MTRWSYIHIHTYINREGDVYTHTHDLLDRTQVLAADFFCGFFDLWCCWNSENVKNLVSFIHKIRTELTFENFYLCPLPAASQTRRHMTLPCCADLYNTTYIYCKNECMDMYIFINMHIAHRDTYQDIFLGCHLSVASQIRRHAI
jgi:hypothetical protein